MKRERKLLLYSSIFMILYLIINIFYEYTNKTLIENLKTDLFITITSSIGIILFIIFSLNKKIDINKHKTIILIFTIYYFLLNIISGVLSFIVYKNLNIKEKRDLPTLENKLYHKKITYIFGFIFCILIMFFLPNYLTGLFGTILMYFLITLITVILFYNELKENLKIFKEYFYEYNSFVLKTFFKSLIVLLIINLSIRLSTGVSNSTNQETLNELFKTNPFLVAFLSIIYAPIVEESLFRGVISKCIKNKYIFIIVSGFLFGLMHVIDDYQCFGDFMYILAYSSLGIFLAYVYNKTNNLCCNIYFHFLQNSIAVLALLLLTFFAK